MVLSFSLHKNNDWFLSIFLQLLHFIIARTLSSLPVCVRACVCERERIDHDFLRPQAFFLHIYMCCGVRESKAECGFYLQRAVNHRSSEAF